MRTTQTASASLATAAVVVSLVAGAAFGTAAGSQGIMREHYVTAMDDPSLRSYIVGALPSPDYCLCLAQDGNDLWVGTTAGAVRWNLKDDTATLYKADKDWLPSLALGKRPYDSPEEQAYVQKWLHDSVEDVIVLSPACVWVGTYQGAMVIREGQPQVFATKEDALASLYKTELRPTLGKVLPMDRKGHLWWARPVGASYLPTFEIRCFDGHAWETVEQPGQSDWRMGNVRQVAADGAGTVWGCGEGGIFCRTDDHWERVVAAAYPDGYSEMRLAGGSTVWAFGRGKLARFDGKGWRTYEAEGRAAGFSGPDSVFLVHVEPAEQRADGKLYFATLQHGLMCFDGQGFRGTLKIDRVGSMAVAPDGQLFAATGDRIWRLDGAEWSQADFPRDFAPPELRSIEDILIAADGTIFAATRNGLYRREEARWEVVSLATRLGQEETPHVPAEEGDWLEMAMEGTLSPDKIEAMCRAYAEREGKDLVTATDAQLADDTVKSEFSWSSVVSYYRLLARDRRRAQEGLEKRIGFLIEEAKKGDALSEELCLCSYGPGIAKPLLGMADSADAKQRWLAIDALGSLEDPEVAQELLKLLDKYGKDENTYAAIAMAAVAAGNPRGMELLIEAATGDPSRGPRLAEPGRAMLQAVTKEFDDLPNDWSRQQWDAWWERHRTDWRRAQDSISEGYAISDHLRQAFEAMAARLEAGRSAE